MTQRRHLLTNPASKQDDPAGVRSLTLIVRAWCSLCDAMRAAVDPIAARHGMNIIEVDLDAHPGWEARFAERVPVLLLGAAPDGEVLAELRLDPAALERRFSSNSFAGDREIR